jgi:fructosamine-3-kinase
MDTKLTLVIKKEVIEMAKKYAAANKISLSFLVENYLKTLTAAKEFSEFELSETVRELHGSLKMVSESQTGHQ